MMNYYIPLTLVPRLEEISTSKEEQNFLRSSRRVYLRRHPDDVREIVRAGVQQVRLLDDAPKYY